MNVARLKGKMAEKGISQEKLAVIIGKSRSTLIRNIYSDDELVTIGQARKIAKELGLTQSETMDIFFNAQ